MDADGSRPTPPRRSAAARLSGGRSSLSSASARAARFRSSARIALSPRDGCGWYHTAHTDQNVGTFPTMRARGSIPAALRADLKVPKCRRGFRIWVGPIDAGCEIASRLEYRRTRSLGESSAYTGGDSWCHRFESLTSIEPEHAYVLVAVQPQESRRDNPREKPKIIFRDQFREAIEVTILATDGIDTPDPTVNKHRCNNRRCDGSNRPARS